MFSPRPPHLEDGRGLFVVSGVSVKLDRMADWHAMLAAVEDPPGTWTMVAPDGREYGTVQIVRRGGEIAYRVTALGRHAGWTSTLRSACERIHHAFIASHSPGPPPGGIYPDLNGITRD